MRLTPTETSTVLLGLRLVEIAKTEGLIPVMGTGSVLDQPEFADYEPTLDAESVPKLRDKVNSVAALPPL